MEHTTIAVDLAKSVFQVAVSHRPGRVDEERRLSRDRFLEFSPRGTAPSARIMAHRSDRRGATPITALARQGRASDWRPARGCP